MLLNYKNYDFNALSELEKQELLSFFGRIKKDHQVYVVKPKHILPPSVLNEFRITNQFNFYNILPSENWKDKTFKTYWHFHSLYLGSGRIIIDFKKNIDSYVKSLETKHGKLNSNLNFVVVETIEKPTRNADGKTVKNFSMVRGLVQVDPKGNINIAFNPDYYELMCRQKNNICDLAKSKYDYLVKSQKLIDKNLQHRLSENETILVSSLTQMQ